MQADGITRRKWNAETNTLNLIVEGTRFCRRIGREHRSNHIGLCLFIESLQRKNGQRIVLNAFIFDGKDIGRAESRF
jgi:hypothetical protein